jgi:hypothetical protein
VPRTTPHSQPPPTPIQVRHRTTATEKVPVLGYPDKLSIYRLNASPYWWVRYWEKGETFRKSTKTRCRQAATAFAKQFFSDIKHRIQHGPTAACTASAFDTVLKSLLASERAKLNRGELTKISYDNQVYRYDKKIRPFFQNVDVTDLDYAMVNEFLNEIRTDDLSSSTISAYIRLVRKVLRHAARQRLIAFVPEIPTVSIKDNPRGSFSASEYLLLVRTARKLMGQRIGVEVNARSRRAQGTVDRFGRIGRDLPWLIRFMVNAFVRPSDIKFLQHKHVTVVRGRHTYLRLNLPETKRHDRPIVTLQAAVAVYERLLAWQQSQGRGQPDDYVFLPEQSDRGQALESLGWQFRHAQTVAGVGGITANGQRRTLYSLRHTAMTFRLLYGRRVDLLTLARNARTSVEMVERFYSSNLAAEMNIDLLQGRRE